MTDIALRRTSDALVLAGIGIAGYLTYVHYAGLQPICGISHGCETVQTSSYASLLGIPVALLGLVSYLLIFVSLRLPGERQLLGGYALTLIAFAFSVYLTVPRDLHDPRDLQLVRVKCNRLHSLDDRRNSPRSAERARGDSPRVSLS